MSKKAISRRTVLKGLGTAIALPWLEAMRPVLSLAAESKPLPRRLAFLYVPNGAHMPAWTPREEGAGFTLPSTLEPLAPFRKELLILTGLTLDGARDHGDGGGDHARAMASFLTGKHVRKTKGADIRAGISVDQVAAEKIGSRTRFPSLELSCDRALQSGDCDTGYSCAYSTNLSWKSPTTPMAHEINPRLVFERLFGNPVKGEAEANRARRARYRKSILDFVREDAGRLKSQLGAPDQRKLDEYLSSVRDIERRVTEVGPAASTGMPAPGGIPADYREHIRLMNDLLVLAFQGDLTRLATFVHAHDGSNRSYRLIGVPEGHHDLSHHGGNKQKQEKIRQINRFHITQLAYLLDKLKGIREGDGTLLDNCMIVFGSGISDGDRHNHDDLPILLAGTGGHSLRSGRHVRCRKETPLTNLYVSLLDRMGVPVASFSDSTGRLEAVE
ncbi:MAG: DUF1552 domain-containing protein [Planctomycetes bacterium]|nr:DUF1552 domain-containing protein [Planctomycetota bacterium]